ncbi:MAG: hypothetical protein B7Y33_05065, partial [Hydrogenophilales bacterium 16-62-9]
MEPKLRIPPLLLLCCLAALGGCSLSPGFRMNSGAEQPAEQAPPVEVRPINFALVNAQTQPVVPAPPASAYEPYRIGPRDVLTITVWDHPELTIPAGEYRSAEAAGYRVGEEGSLFFPYVGVLKAEGKTVEELRNTLSIALAPYITKPQLDVRVVEFRSQRTYIVGEVLRPGIQPVTDVPLTVVEAINRVGGLTPQADVARATLSRAGQTYPVDLGAIYRRGDITQNVLLQNGDVLNVPGRDESKIFVLGEVVTPASQLMVKGSKSLAEAISDAGGVNATSADPSRIYVIRAADVADAAPQVFRLNGESVDALILADRFQLRPRDVVYVDTASLSRWNRVLTQLL